MYVYAGYPALLTLIARIWGRKDEYYTPIIPSVTLLIAAYNEEAVIAEKLDNSLALDYPAGCLQIIVTADGSNDDTPDIVRRYAQRGVKLAYEPARRGKMAAINRAMSLAKGDIVVFSDANNMYDTHTLHELVKPFSNPTVGAVSGAKQILKGDGALGESEGLYWKYESFIKQQESLIDSCSGAAGEILALRRTLFESPPDEVINDDFYMALRLIQQGHRVIYAPKARSYERVSASAQDEVTRRTRIVAGRYQAMAMAKDILPFNRPLIAWQIISHKFLRPFVPLTMIGAFITNVVALIRPSTKRNSLSSPIGSLLLATQIVFYGLAWLGNQIEVKGKVGKLLYLPTFLVNSNLAALQGLVRYLSNQQTTLWTRVQRRE